MWKEPDEIKTFTEEEENISKERVQRMGKKGIIFDFRRNDFGFDAYLGRN